MFEIRSILKSISYLLRTSGHGIGCCARHRMLRALMRNQQPECDFTKLTVRASFCRSIKHVCLSYNNCNIVNSGMTTNIPILRR
jgi:hypothetical protein